jgi:hypothetical protein
VNSVDLLHIFDSRLAEQIHSARQKDNFDLPSEFSVALKSLSGICSIEHEADFAPKTLATAYPFPAT